MKKTPFLIALFNPSTLSMLALTAAAGLCAAWWLAPVGLVIWAVMVATIAREPTLQFTHILETRTPLAAKFQKRFEPINRTHVRLFNAIVSSKRKHRREFQPILQLSTRLIDQAYALCLQLTPMENNRLVNQTSNYSLLELENMQTKIEHAEDPIVKREYQEAYQAIQRRIERMDHFSTQLDRVDAQMISLKNDLENIYSTIISLQSKPINEVKMAVPEILQSLDQKAEDIERFEREIDH